MTTATETKTAAPTTPSLPFGMPFMPPFGADMWSKAMHDGMDRARAFWDEYARLEAQGLAHTRTMLGESARLANETLTYAAHLGTEWRKMSFDAMKRATDAAR